MSNSYSNIRVFFLLVIAILVTACEKNDSQVWQIGGGKPMQMILADLEEINKIKVCSDEYKKISFPVILHVIYDDQKYYGLLEGVCITVNAKKVTVAFATPSSGKIARGTFEIQ